MSVKKAQAIANLLEDELGFSVTSYNSDDLEFLKTKLDEFLKLEVEPEDLTDSSFTDVFDEDVENWDVGE